MAKMHLFSNSLYEELFRHNLISSKGYVIANEEKLKKYYDFLEEHARDKTTDIYKERNAMLKEVQLLLREEDLDKCEMQKLKRLLQNLSLEISDNGLLLSKEPAEVKPRYLGPSGPNQTLWERQFVASEKRMKILKHDMRVLNKWLDELSRPTCKVLKVTPSTLPEQKKIREKHYKERTKRRHEEMSAARRLLINSYHKGYEKSPKVSSRSNSKKKDVKAVTSVTTNPTDVEDATSVTADMKALNKAASPTNDAKDEKKAASPATHAKDGKETSSPTTYRPGDETASSYYTVASHWSSTESDFHTDDSSVQENVENKNSFQDAEIIEKNNSSEQAVDELDQPPDLRCLW